MITTTYRQTDPAPVVTLIERHQVNDRYMVELTLDGGAA